MRVVRVAVPVSRGKRRFHLDKGRSWTVIEHLILTAVTSADKSADELVRESDLPRTVILESIIRLMHAGWVELLQGPKEISFRATAAGLDVVDRDELPAFPKRIARKMNLVLDKITGTVFRSRDLPLFEKHIIEERMGDEVVWIEGRDVSGVDQIRAIAATLFDDDERFVAMEPAADRFVDRYALLQVRDGRVEGLPSTAPPELEAAIQEAAKTVAERPSRDGSTSFRVPDALLAASLEPQIVTFGADDLILGGKAHEDLFHSLIRTARHDLIIHSTFMAEERVEALRPALIAAVQRGVQVHILWGEDRDKTGMSTTRKAVSSLREKFAKAGLDGQLQVHPFSTGSHAKILVADAGRPDKHVAVIGSCNWLYSGFSSFECSVRLRDPAMVSTVVEQLAELSQGMNRHWTELTNHFPRLAFDTARQQVPAGAKAKSMLVLGADHSTFMHQARDDARQRIFVVSHRIGPRARIGFALPAITAARARGLSNVRAYYGKPAELGEGAKAVDLAREAREATDSAVQIRPVHEPMVHAKVLAWDDDFAVISSLNWLSADPSEGNRRGEIGIYVNAAGIARRIIEVFDHARRA